MSCYQVLGFAFLVSMIYFITVSQASFYKHISLAKRPPFTACFIADAKLICVDFFWPLLSGSSHAFFSYPSVYPFVTKKTSWLLLMDRVERHKTTEPSRGNSVHLLIKPPEVLGTRFIHHERKKGWARLDLPNGFETGISNISEKQYLLGYWIGYNNYLCTDRQQGSEEIGSSNGCG